MKNKYDKMTQEQFDNILGEIIKENCGNLITIPGAYEIFSEYFNNEVLDRWDNENA